MHVIRNNVQQDHVTEIEGVKSRKIGKLRGELLTGGDMSR